jgi:NDP-sugar pyrophosphorylase family protein
MMTVLHNDGRWDVSNAIFDGRVVRAYDKRNPTAEMTWIDYGLGGLDERAIALVDSRESDLSALYAALAVVDQLAGYAVEERFYEIGSPAAFAETEAFLLNRR